MSGEVDMANIKIAVGGSLGLLAIVVVAIIATGGSISAFVSGGDVGLVLGGLFLAVVGVLIIYWFKIFIPTLIVGLIFVLIGVLCIIGGI